MRIVLPLLLSIVLLPNPSEAQRLPPSTDTTGVSSATIYLQGTAFGGYKYVQDGEYYSAGGSFGRLKDTLIDVPEAYALAEVGSKIVTHGRIVSVLGTVIGAATFFVHGEIVEWGFTIGGFAIAGAGGAIQMKGLNRINKAVWLYNSEIENRTRKSS